MFSAKMIKAIKGSFVVELKNFYHYLLEIEAKEITGKNIKVALPVHCFIKIKSCLAFW